MGTLASMARMRLLAMKIRSSGARVRCIQKLATEEPEVRLDPSQIKQALVNLVKNAMQAMTRTGTLTLATGASPDFVWIEISDTGSGIPADQLNRLFQPFNTTKDRGTGLGLMVVQRIIRDHGGRIDFESRVGKGTRFTLWLPRLDRSPLLLSAGPAEGTPTSG